MSSIMKAFCKLFIFFTFLLLSISLTAQSEKTILGKWYLQKTTFKKTHSGNSNNNESLLNVFKASLYDKLTAEQGLEVEYLEELNTNAEILRDKYYQSTIEFQSNGAYYNTPLNLNKSLSGEYLLDKKKLLLEWETGDKNEFKVLKITDDALVLKDSELKISYHYLKTKTD